LKLLFKKFLIDSSLNIDLPFLVKSVSEAFQTQVRSVRTDIGFDGIFFVLGDLRQFFNFRLEKLRLFFKFFFCFWNFE